MNNLDKHDADTQPLRRPPNWDQAAGPELVSQEVAEDRAEPTPADREDTIPTPRPLPIPAATEQVLARRSPRTLHALVGLALFCGLLSLALNGILIYKLLAVRQFALDGLDQASRAIDTLTRRGFRYDFPFQQTVEFAGDIPIKLDMAFPFRGNVPIKQTIAVPVDLGVMKTVVQVPIDMNFPVDVTVPVHIDESFPIKTSIPISTTIPIYIAPDSPPVRDLIGPVREWLAKLRELFSFP